MFDQSRRLSEPLRWGRREKTAVAVVVTCLLLAVIGLGVHALTSSSPERADCIDVTLPCTPAAGKPEPCAPRRVPTGASPTR
jgi:hypothetical protein